MLKIGMYVRCPVDEETYEARTYLLGQVTAISKDGSTVEVTFHDPQNLRNFFVNLPSKVICKERYLSHTPALENSSVMLRGTKVRLLSISKVANKDNSFYNYFVEYFKNGKATVGEVSETQIEIPFTRSNYNPANQMLKYELQNPSWYLERRVVSKSLNKIANAPNGFKNLLGTRVQLFSHQVDTIVRALSENPCRLMLADEVGLGKTIEALAIIKGKLDKFPKMRSLIVVPETLVYQWQTELSFKFWFDVPIWGVDNIENSKIILVPLGDIEKDYDEICALGKWDMCVVDETHKLLGNDKLYNAVLGLCKNVDNLLLLSATPILHREQEYHKLLTLLNPQRFEKMPVDIFNNLLTRQKSIRDIVFNLMRDLSDYMEYGLHDDFITGLSQINEEIQDNKLVDIISKIDGNAEDKGLSFVKIALSYIAEFYQIERGIIRHRRAEIAGANIKRELIDNTYDMVGSEKGFFEENCYNAVVDYAGSFCQKSHGKSNIDFVKKLISAVSSSPYALLELINNNKKIIVDNDEISVMKSLAKKWEKALDSEISRIEDICDDIDSFNSKFARIIDYIDQEDVNCDKKFLVFTGFTATAQKLEECFRLFFGTNSTCSFHSGKTGEEMQEAASLFQNDDKFRFMICDESGGEGRNFQIADYIIHCDLPWSPALLEQRIGRLDRIGRDNKKNVISVVIYSENSLENDLFNIYDKGLNIFNQSLCGMEIAFEQIHNTIETALINDVRFGLANVIDDIVQFAEQMNGEIERERYFDLARQLDIDLQKKLEKLIAHFTVDDGKELMDTMMAWPHMAGFRGITFADTFSDGSEVVLIDVSNFNKKSMENALYFPPKVSEIIKRSKYKNDIRGTFSRTAAVKHENLTFFAPLNPLFDSITTNSEECYKGRSVAFKYVDCDFKWTGLLQTWSIKYNPLMLYKEGFSSELISLISRYLPSEQIIFSQGANLEFNEISTIEVIEQLERLNKKKPIHLGKRDDGMIDSFKKAFTTDTWRDYIKKSYTLGKKYTKQQAKIYMEAENARKELERILTVNTAREIFYGYGDENSLLQNAEAIDALIYGLENPIIELDSIAFIIFD